MGEYAVGMSMCDRAVLEADRDNDAYSIAWAYAYRCGTAFVMGDAVATQRDGRAGIRACTAAGFAWGAAACSAWLGRSLLMQRMVPEAVAHLQETLELSRGIGDPFSAALALSFYGSAMGANGDYERAAAYLDEALNLFRTLGCYAQMSRCLVDWSVIALGDGRIEDAAKALSEGLTITNQLGRVPYRQAQLLSGAAQVAAAREHWSEAAQLLVSAREMRLRSGTKLPPEREAGETLLRQMLAKHLSEHELSVLASDARRLDEAAALALAQDVLARVRARATGRLPT